MEHISNCCRVGLMVGGHVQSVRCKGITWTELPSTLDEVREWFLQQSHVEEDTSMIGYFYRCMEEGAEFYYLYDESEGWRCGGVTTDTPLRGKLVSLDEAQGMMEEWIEDLKYRVNMMST